MSKMTQKIFVMVSVLAILVSLPMMTARQAEAQKVLKLGSLVPLAFSKEGVEIKKWNDLFAKIINEQGGWLVGGQRYKVEFYTYDVGYWDQSKTLAAVEKGIYQDGVKIFTNSFGDVPDLTALHCDKNKVLVMAVGFGDAVVSTKYQYIFRPFGGFFTAGTNYLIARDFYKKGARSTLASTMEGEFGRIAAEQYTGAEALAGMKVLPPVFYGADTVDFGPIATKIKSLNPDMVDFVVAAGDMVVNLATALKDAGWKGFIFPGAGINATTLANIVKRVGSWFDGTEMLCFDPRDTPVVAQNPEMKALMDRYTKEYGEFQTEGCAWVSGWFSVKGAINATQSVDTTVLKDYLGNGPKPQLTLTGYSQLFARPDIKQYRTVDGGPPNGWGIVKNGKLEYLGQITAKDQYLITIKYRKLVDVYQKYWDQYGKPDFGPEKSNFDFADLTK
jgi:ABC-type branched-subunit amino acid transport system substrate-binding protein